MLLKLLNRVLFTGVALWMGMEVLYSQQFNTEFTSPTEAYTSLSIERLNNDTVMILPLHYNAQYNKIGFETMIIAPNGTLQQSRTFFDTLSSTYVGWSNSLNHSGASQFVLGGSFFKDTLQMGKLVVFNSVGDTLWTKLYGTPSTSNNVFRQARRTSNGGFIIVGNHAFKGQRSDGWLVKTDSAGNMLWDKKYSTTIGTLERLVSVQETHDGGFILGGQEQEFPNQASIRNHDPILIKVDSMGNQQWRYRYDTPYDDEMAYCIQTFDGNFVCASSYNYLVSGIELSRAMLFKVSSSGQFMWKKEYGPIKHSHAFYMVKQLPDSSLIAVGKRFETSDLIVGVMVKAKANGDSIFVNSYEYDPSQTLNRNRLHDVIQMSDGGFMACGEVIHDASVANRQNPWLIRVDSNGCILSNCLVGLNEQEFKGESKIVSVFPNPSNGTFQLIGIQPQQLALYDLQGRKLVVYDPNKTNWQLPEVGGVYLLHWRDSAGNYGVEKVMRE